MKKYTAYLSPVAELKLDKLLAYLVEKWGNKSKTKFLIKFEQAVM